MEYAPIHAQRALEIIERWKPTVPARPEYDDLVDVLRSPTRWPEAHELFQRIRVNITLPAERNSVNTLGYYFVFLAENAAKTAYNCSGEPAPFDNDSFDSLLMCEQRFIDKEQEGSQRPEL